MIHSYPDILVDGQAAETSDNKSIYTLGDSHVCTFTVCAKTTLERETCTFLTGVPVIYAIGVHNGGVSLY